MSRLWVTTASIKSHLTHLVYSWQDAKVPRRSRSEFLWTLFEVVLGFLPFLLRKMTKTSHKILRRTGHVIPQRKAMNNLMLSTLVFRCVIAVLTSIPFFQNVFLTHSLFWRTFVPPIHLSTPPPSWASLSLNSLPYRLSLKMVFDMLPTIVVELLSIWRNPGCSSAGGGRWANCGEPAFDCSEPQRSYGIVGGAWKVGNSSLVKGDSTSGATMWSTIVWAFVATSRYGSSERSRTRTKMVKDEDNSTRFSSLKASSSPKH